MLEVDAIILASGLSKRMGANKLLLPFKDSTLLGYFLDSFSNFLFRKVILVVSDEKVAQLAGDYAVTICHNPCPEEGQSRAIREGLKSSVAKDGIMFFVADQPLLLGETLETLLAEFREKPDRIIVPVIGGKRKNPVIFPSSFRQELDELRGDIGGRGVIKNNESSVFLVECMNVDEFSDIDTVEHYTTLVDKCRKNH